MKKNNRFVTTMLTGTALLGLLSANAGAIRAVPSTHKLYVNNQLADVAAYNIEGNNYFKLRDIAKLVGFGVAYDPQVNSVALTSNQPYEEDGSGGGGKTAVQATDNAKLSPQTIYVDGAQQSPTVYNINGNNYFKLRDLGEMIDFSVGFTAATSRVDIDTEKPYAAEQTTPATGTTTVAVPDTAIKTWDTVMSKFTGELYQSNNPTQYPFLDKRQYICSDTKKYLEIAKKYAPQITGKPDGTVEEVIAVLDNVKESPEEYGKMKHFGKTTSQFYADELRKALGQKPIYGIDSKSDESATQTTQPTQETEKPADISPVTEADLRAWELEMVDAVNEERRKAGVSELVVSEEAMAYAQYWAEHCKTDFRHSVWSDMRTYGKLIGKDPEATLQVLTGGENIGRFFQSNKNAVVSYNMQMVMESPGHKATMLDPDLKHIGIGFAIAEDKTIYCVQRFPQN